MTQDGILYGVDELKINGKVIGYISEEGMTPGGNAPQKTEIWAAQKRDAPVKILRANAGTKTWKFTLIQLLPAHIVAVMGGTAGSDGSYTPPEDEVIVEGPVELKFTSGEIMVIHRASLTASFANAINTNGVLGIECELSMMKAVGGGPSFRIFPPDVTPMPDPDPQPGEEEEEDPTA